MTATEPSTVQPAAALDRPLFLTGFMGCGKTTLGRAQMTKLKVYAGAEHPHAAQNPTKIELEA